MPAADGGGYEVIRAAVHAQQQLGIELRQGIAQVAQGGNPGAMHRQARAAQDAVNGLDRVPCRAEHDERYGVLLVQPTLLSWRRNGCGF